MSNSWVTLLDYHKESENGKRWLIELVVQYSPFNFFFLYAMREIYSLTYNLLILWEPNEWRQGKWNIWKKKINDVENKILYTHFS